MGCAGVACPEYGVVRVRRSVTDLHWRLWALECASGYDSGIGYPRVNVLHTPPRRGDTSEKVPVPPEPPDLALARQLGKGVAELARHDAGRASALVAWWGVSTTKGTRTDRLRKAGYTTYHSGRDAAVAARNWVEGWVSNFREFHGVD